MSTAYHPQTDGQTERVNQVLEETLRHFVEGRHKDWDKYLTSAEFAYNNTIHTATGHTPFEMDCGQHPVDPLGVLTESFSQHAPVEETEEYLRLWKEMQERALAAMRRAKERMCVHPKRKAMEFEVGQMVWLDTEHITFPNVEGKLGKRGKFDHRYMGPYKIVKATSNKMAYTLELPKHQKFHPVQPVSRLEPVTDSKRGPNQKGRSRDPPLPVITEEGDTEYEVESILGKRLHYGKIKYLVKWKGYPDSENQWEPLANLANAMRFVRDYERYNSGLALNYILSTICLCSLRSRRGPLTKDATNH